MATNEIDAVRALRDDELDAISGGEGTVSVCQDTAITFEGKGMLVMSTGCGGYPTARWFPAA